MQATETAVPETKVAETAGVLEPPAITEALVGLQATEKSNWITTVTPTWTVVVLDNALGAVPVVPVIVRVNVFGVGSAVQLTLNVVPETVAVQPVEAALAEKVTGPVKPLIPVNDKVDV